MLQRLISLDDELYGDGTWSSAQLEQMNDRFVAAVETAFRAASSREWLPLPLCALGIGTVVGC